MGKKKNKDLEKRAALQLKKEAKAEKAARKRLQKEAKQQGGGGESEENVDELLELYRQKDAQVDTTVLESLGDEQFPPPRANATLTLGDNEHKNLYMFGGEYFDGIENIVLDELLRWDTKKGEWKRILTPAPRPPPRCAHSTVYYRNALYVFGGEMATADQYHHYRDLWRFDLNTQTWSEIRSSTGTCPTARSGHMAVVWKNYMVVFGGFYEALRDTRWYNDVCVMDLQTHIWLDMPHSKLATRPEPRSACNVGIFGDVALFHGGFCKLKNPTTKAESKVHTDCWMLHLKPILNGRLPTWERVSIRSSRSSAFTPNNRSGTASIAYKNRLLVYGGVIDTEQHHHRVDSVFYNDLFAFDVERRKWFPLRVKPQSTADGKPRRRRKKPDHEAHVIQNDGEEEEDNDESSDMEDDEQVMVEGDASGWDLDMLRSNMFAFVDGDGNIVYEKIQEEEEKEKEADLSDGYIADTGEVSAVAQEGGSEEEREEEKENDEEKEEEKEETIKDDVKPSARMVDKGPEHADISKCAVSSSSVMAVNKDTGTPEPVARAEPLPRINASMAVQGHTLYIYGGVLEVGDREVTLDDCWSFDLRKRDKWICIWEGSMHKQVWRGAAHDDDDSYISTGVDEDDDETEDDGSGGEGVGSLRIAGDETNAAKKVSKKEKSKRSGVRHEIAELKEKLNLDDSMRTPQMGEVMADFYARTSEYWSQQAVAAVQEKASEAGDSEKLSSKEFKREGFNLAKGRFDELRPLLDRLNELDLQQQEAEEERKTRKADKDKTKKNKEKKKERRNR